MAEPAYGSATSSPGLASLDIVHIQQPSPITDPTINYVVLGFALLFEGGAWWVAFREFQKSKDANVSYFQAIRDSKDPTTFTVLFEDTAAMLGLVVAFLGVLLGSLPSPSWSCR